MPDVFVSYSRRDGEFARRLHAALSKRGKDVWIDWEDIAPSVKWRVDIREAIEGSDGFVFVVSRHSIGSSECSKELGLALERGKRIVPLVIEKPDGDVPEPLREYNWIFAGPSDDFDDSVGKVVTALETDQEWVRAHTRLGVRAEEWRAHEHGGAYLLTGADLQEAERLITTAPKRPKPTAVQLEYVAAGRTAARRRQRLLLAGVGVALVVALGLAVLAFLQRSTAIDQRQQATSRELAAQALRNLGTDPQLSLLLAQRAVETKPTTSAVEVLRQALLASHIRAVIPVPTGAQSTTVGFGHDGRLVLAVGEGDGVPRLYDPASKRLVHAFPVAVGVAVGGAQLDPTGPRLLTIDRAGQAAVWDTASGSRLFTVPVRGRVTAVGWRADGARIAAAGPGGTIGVFDARDGRRVAAGRAPARRLGSVALSADGRYLAAGENRPTDPRAFVFALGSTSAPRALRTFGYVGVNVAYPPRGGSRLLTVGAGGAELWPAAGGARIARLSPTAVSGVSSGKGQPSKSPPGATFGRDGTTVLTTDQPGGEAWRARDGGPQAAFRLPVGAGLSGDLAPGGARAATGDDQGIIHVWRTTDGQELSALRPTPGGGVTALTYDPPGRRIASVGTDGALRIWDTGLIEPWLERAADFAVLSPDARLLAVGSGDGLELVRPRTGARVASVAGRDATFSADGSRLATTTRGDEVVVYRASDRRALARFGHPGLGPAEVSLSADGTRVATQLTDAHGAGGLVEVRRVGAKRYARLGAATPAFAVSPGGERAALVRGGRVELRATDTGRLEHPVALRDSAVSPVVAFSGDGARVAVGTDQRLTVLDAASGAVLRVRTTTRGDGPTSIALDASGARVLVGERFGHVQLWQVDSGRELPALIGSTAHVGRVRFSHDGQFALTSDDTETTRVYQLSDDALLSTLPGGRASWSDDGLLIATSTGVRAAVWPCDVCRGAADLLRFSRSRVVRPLGPGERSTYLHG